MTGRGDSGGATTRGAVVAHQTDPVRSPEEELREHIEVLKRTYLFLRISLVGVVAAIFLAIVLTPNEYMPTGEDFLRSISHYYYTPARTVFTAALCAGALALLAISGSGVQSYLLDLAALLSPLIGIIPTRTLRSELGAAADLGPCVAGWPQGIDCIPENQLDYVAVGFHVWAIGAGTVLLFALVQGLFRRFKKGNWGSKWYWIVLALGVATVVLYLVWWWSPWSALEHEALQIWGHLTAAGAFFLIIMIVAAIEAVRQWSGHDSTDQEPAFLPRRVYAVIYGVLALGFIVDLGYAVWLLARPEAIPDGNAVLWVEIFGLVCFALFWGFQTLEHARDAEGWQSPTPRR